MSDTIIIIKTLFASLGAILGAFLGGLSGLLVALVALMICDYITGVLCAIKSHKVNSSVGFWGIVKKCLILMMVGVANLLDVNVVGSGSVLRSSVVMFYMANDGISILENIGKLGLPIPKKLRVVLEQLKEDDDEQ
jgi:toxin secretion/phage lysis holin